QAAMGIVQLQKLNDIIEKKRRLADMYKTAMAGIPGLQLPVELPWARHVYWMFPLTVQPEFGMTRDRLAEHLRERGIETRTFFCPMNLQPCFAHLDGCARRSCPVAEEIWQTCMYLPSSVTLTKDKVDFIVEAIREVSQL